MMLQGITSRGVEITSPLLDVFVSSRVVETGIGGSERGEWEKPIKTSFLFAFSLSEMMQTENASSIYQPPKFETETVLTEELYRKSEQRRLLLLKISEMIDRIKITDEEGLFNGINKYKLLETISKMLSDISVDWDKISDEELFERTKRILVLEAMFGILKELTPEQIKIFDEAIKKRSLFK